jgi:hypothetical protein
MAGQEIYCTVNSCFYYGQGDKCVASKIMVKNNPDTLRNSNMEVGSLGSQANHSHQTFCETFVPQAHGPKPGIERLSSAR